MSSIAEPHVRSLAGLPGTITVPEAASLLGVSKSAAYRAIDARLRGDSEAWPTNVIRIGRTIRIPSAELRALLRIEPAA
ncbi:MAG: helix-turn-helix domain-containing protein [Actinomycetota bacterium]|nr:helix-turn-helix domain-containing protein [Actinomycetota bacterium]